MYSKIQVYNHTFGNKFRHENDISAKKLKDGIIKTIILCARICFILNYVISFQYIASASMEPTLVTGNITIYNHLAYLFDDVRRGDIVLFSNNQSNGDLYSKRVIGIAGDKVEFKDGDVFLNGAKLNESEYLPVSMETYCDKTFTVPEGCCFVMGDNRAVSYDSRYWEEPFVTYSDIKAKYLITVPGLFR